MDGTLTDIFDSNDIEVITDVEVTKTIPIINNEKISEEINPSVIAPNILKEDVIEEIKPQKKMDKILLIQLILLATWAILTALIYFFGYDLFSKFIDVSR